MHGKAAAGAFSDGSLFMTGIRVILLGPAKADYFSLDNGLMHHSQKCTERNRSELKVDGLHEK